MILRLRANPMISKSDSSTRDSDKLPVPSGTGTQCLLQSDLKRNLTQVSLNNYPGRQGRQRFALGLVQRKEGTSKIVNAR